MKEHHYRNQKHFRIYHLFIRMYLVNRMLCVGNYTWIIFVMMFGTVTTNCWSFGKETIFTKTLRHCRCKYKNPGHFYLHTSVKTFIHLKIYIHHTWIGYHILQQEMFIVELEGLITLWSHGWKCDVVLTWNELNFYIGKW